MNRDQYLSVLNPEQYAAVTHEGSPLLILAGAGSGKTRVITTKIAWLIAEQGVPPESILAVTFTNKAAREMAQRATRLEPRAERSVLRTFHSFGAWLLRRNASLAGLVSNFTIYDDDDAVTLLAQSYPALTRQQISFAAHKIARAKDYGYGFDSPFLAEIDPDPEFAEMYRTYERRLRGTGNLDFGDLILLPVRLLEEHPEVRSRIHSRFSVIMVDEYQDSNVAQFEFLRSITGPETYLCVVGDDDQSIYRFRGAEVRNILTFADSFSGTEIIKLERNYRSTEPILDTASRVVAYNSGRLGKTLLAERGGGKNPVLTFLPNQDDEAKFCAALIQNARDKGCPYQDWAILYRTNAQSLGFETEFLHRKIPYKVVGSLKFYEREEIKDALAFLALIANGRDEVAFRRIVNKPARGVGQVTQDRIVAEAHNPSADPETVSFDFDEKQDLFSASRAVLPSLSKKAKSGLSDFLTIIDSLSLLIRTPENDEQSGDDKQKKTARKKGAVGLAVFVEKLLERSGLLDYHAGQDEIAGTQKVANLQELMNASSLYPLSEEGLLEFLEHIELDRSMVEEENTNPDSVTLITLHNTKGLEFPRVIITGLETGVFPREDKKGDDLEEERRLMYVGCTRAMDELYFTSCAMRRLYGRAAYMEPSRFLSEIGTENIDVQGMVPRSFSSRISLSGLAHGGYNPLSGNQERSSGPGGEYGKWKTGQKLFHDDYGYGIITEVAFTDPSDPESGCVIFVDFETGGRKRFLPEFQEKDLLLIGEDD
ncbi:ATP-dependent helicase [Brucepastera parasyntrophica]|uniref:ATP-dependent helicase n=1 Tax=Brucepastera parasyntrophica TaxID=2880008 RepID=UPI00210C2131|nr:UvrD-helicase domain-containing protein [Brucepastera parasyntrophica]ULQ60738.1 ATP-dependent helicase [Brucepastera parasyntrophica]